VIHTETHKDSFISAHPVKHSLGATTKVHDIHTEHIGYATQNHSLQESRVHTQEFRSHHETPARRKLIAYRVGPAHKWRSDLKKTVVDGHIAYKLSKDFRYVFDHKRYDLEVKHDVIKLHKKHGAISSESESEDEETKAKRNFSTLIKKAPAAVQVQSTILVHQEPQ